MVHKCCRKFDFSLLTCKAYGLVALAFCVGTIVGLFLPIYIVAVLETALLMALAYLCLFQW